jgi:signal transduction histidine kinase
VWHGCLTDPQEVHVPSSVERLRDEAFRFVRRFGVVAALWSTLLALGAPTVGRPAVLWAGIGVIWAWALLSQAIQPPRVWFVGWLLTAFGAELLGPVAATHGWSVTGGIAFIALAGSALSGRRGPVVFTVVWLSVAALLRGILADGWSIAGSLGTLLIFVFGGLALAWLVRVLMGGLEERDRLQAALVDAERETARQVERAEASARLHDTVLQHLTSIGAATTVDDARRAAGRASNELRSFLRLPHRSGGSLREAIEAAAVAAADGVEVSFGAVADQPRDDRGDRLVEAAAEAVRNAAAHAAGPIRVFAEFGDDGAVVWIADRGPGFDLDAVPADRLGIRDSIVGRMQRSGGSATVTSTASGTEWELRLPAPPR